jgi:hypothetical protein
VRKHHAKYLAIWLGILILVPQIEKGIHDYPHQENFVCNALTKHLHKAQPQCPICDFLSTVTYIPVENQVELGSVEFYFISFPDTGKNFIPKTGYYVTLRAPPGIKRYA